MECPRGTRPQFTFTWVSNILFSFSCEMNLSAFDDKLAQAERHQLVCHWECVTHRAVHRELLKVLMFLLCNLRVYL